MKKTLEICASFTGTIPTGQYENEKPFYSVKETVDVDTEESPEYLDSLIETRQKILHDMCYRQFKRQADQAYQERIQAQYKNIRFYPSENGLVPSVTSIVGMDKEFGIPADELAQYSARGICLHKQAEVYLDTGVWKDVKDLAEVSTEYITVVQGSLGLSLDNVDFKAFYKDYPFKVLQQETEVINNAHNYGGRLDILCIIKESNKGKWDKVEGVEYDKLTVLDIKTSTTLDKISGLTQQAAYSKCVDAQQIGLIHLTKDNKCGFAKPVITTNIPRYWDLFIKKRENFKNRYGV